MHWYILKESLSVFSNTIDLECSMVVHRRCRSKAGDYCGCKEKSMEAYEQWKTDVNELFEKEIKIF